MMLMHLIDKKAWEGLKTYPKWVLGLEVVFAIIGLPIRLFFGAIARLEDWLGDHIG